MGRNIGIPTRTRLLRVVCTPAEEARLKHAAAAAGQALSPWLRRVGLAAAQVLLEPASEPVSTEEISR
jgi:hypothetical protein